MKKTSTDRQDLDCRNFNRHSICCSQVPVSCETPTDRVGKQAHYQKNHVLRSQKEYQTSVEPGSFAGFQNTTIDFPALAPLAALPNRLHIQILP